jgi:hypothetical protein
MNIVVHRALATWSFSRDQAHATLGLAGAAADGALRPHVRAGLRFCRGGRRLSAHP